PGTTSPSHNGSWASALPMMAWKSPLSSLAGGRASGPRAPSAASFTRLRSGAPGRETRSLCWSMGSRSMAPSSPCPHPARRAWQYRSPRARLPRKTERNMQYGYFDQERCEYAITTPRTPVPWINYIGSLQFGGFVDHTGGMLICRQDPALNRITRYVGVLPASSFKGSTLYLRLHTPEGYRLLSPFFVPTLGPVDHYACHV